jgi:aspartate/methionine/tyrosine aminotransferase
MFEEGTRLAEQYGRDKVFDFSIGNPNLEPPEACRQVLEELVCDPRPGLHGYMSNAVTRRHGRLWPPVYRATRECRYLRSTS